jgi:flagellar basal body rod protein FlgG
MIRGLDSAAAGMAMQAQRFERTAQRIAQLPGAGGEGDLVADTVEQIDAKQAFSANVAVARTADEMLGTIINIKI